MAKIQKIVYGDDFIRVIADTKGYTLCITTESSQAVFIAASREDMAEIVNDLKQTMFEIEYELNSSCGIFSGLDAKKENDDGKHDDL